MQETLGLAAAATTVGVTGFVQGSIREADRIEDSSVSAGGRLDF